MAFIVLYDRHLRAIATTRPKTLAELRKVDGIGPTKLELYGRLSPPSATRMKKPGIDAWAV